MGDDKKPWHSAKGRRKILKAADKMEAWLARKPAGAEYALDPKDVQMFRKVEAALKEQLVELRRVLAMVEGPGRRD